jgi:hypothetical protein
MTQPASVVNDGNHLLLAVPSLADPAEPTVAELTDPAVLDVTCYLTDTGWTPNMQQARVADPRLCSEQDFELPGRLGFQPQFTYVSNPANPTHDEARLTLTPGSTFFLVWRPLVSYAQPIQAGDLVSVYPVQFGEQEYSDPAQNTPGTVTQQIFLRPPGRQFMVEVTAS